MHGGIEGRQLLAYQLFLQRLAALVQGLMHHHASTMQHFSLAIDRGGQYWITSLLRLVARHDYKKWEKDTGLREYSEHSPASENHRLLLDSDLSWADREPALLKFSRIYGVRFLPSLDNSEEGALHASNHVASYKIKDIGKDAAKTSAIARVRVSFEHLHIFSVDTTTVASM